MKNIWEKYINLRNLNPMKPKYPWGYKPRIFGFNYNKKQKEKEKMNNCLF